MAYRRRAAATDLLTGDGPVGSPLTTGSIGAEIAAPTGTGEPSPNGRDDPIVAASQPTVVLSSIPVTVTQERTVVATPTATATATPSATPAPAHSGLATGAIAGIVVAVVLILMIPAGYLIWRSHQMKKEEEWRASQRSSQEAMVMKESVEPKRDNGPPPPRPRRDDAEPPRERPTNSLGLFNFDLGNPSPAPLGDLEKKPEPKKEPFSIAKTLQLRRSEVSVASQERRSQQQIADLRNGLRNNPPTTRTSREFSERASPPTQSDSKFAPLNNIGTAVSSGRPKFSRNGSSSTIPRQFSPSPPPPQEMPRPRTATGPRQSPHQSPSQNDMSRPRTAASPQQSPSQKDIAPPPYVAFNPRQPPPGTQDMRQGGGLLIAENLPSSRITNPPISAYSMSNYHDSLRPEPKSDTTSEQQARQHPEPVVYGRAVSPVHRSISPINNYQLPTLGLGGNDRFSWGVGGTMTHNEEAERRKQNDLSRKNSMSRKASTSRKNSTGYRRNDIAERQSEVSNLSYHPADDNRQSDLSNGRPISPIESEEDFGMRTREYR